MLVTVLPSAGGTTVTLVNAQNVIFDDPVSVSFETELSPDVDIQQCEDVRATSASTQTSLSVLLTLDRQRCDDGASGGGGSGGGGGGETTYIIIGAVVGGVCLICCCVVLVLIVVGVLFIPRFGVVFNAKTDVDEKLVSSRTAAPSRIRNASWGASMSNSEAF